MEIVIVNIYISRNFVLGLNLMISAEFFSIYISRNFVLGLNKHAHETHL